MWPGYGVRRPLLFPAEDGKWWGVADPSAEESAHEERKSRRAKENESDGYERVDGFGREGEAGEKEMCAEGEEAAG